MITTSRTLPPPAGRARAPRRGAVGVNGKPLPLQPLLQHLDIRLAAAGSGESRFEITVRDFHLRTGGIAHGGLYATIMDAITGYAAFGSLPAGRELMTIQLNLNMTGMARAGDRLIATARTQHAGASTAVALGEIRRADGKLLATGSATLLFVARKKLTSARAARRRASPVS